MKEEQKLPHPVFGKLRDSWDDSIWESFVTVCFTAPDSGWADLVLVSSARGQHHVAYLSTVGTPYHDLLDWLNDIVADKLPATVSIDEEGSCTRLRLLPYSDQRLEFRALRPADMRRRPDGSWEDAPEQEAERGIVCRVQKYEFLAEWRRRLKDFIWNDFRLEAWDAGIWHDYLENLEPYPRWADLRRLDFSLLDGWLERNRPRTFAIRCIIVNRQTRVGRVVFDWAAKRGLLCAERIANDRLPSQKTLDPDQISGKNSWRHRIRAEVRDADGTLILSATPELASGAKEAALFAKRFDRAWLHLHPRMDWHAALHTWLESTSIRTLNVAGAHDHKEAEIAEFTLEVLENLNSCTGIGLSRSPIC